MLKMYTFRNFYLMFAALVMGISNVASASPGEIISGSGYELHERPYYPFGDDQSRWSDRSYSPIFEGRQAGQPTLYAPPPGWEGDPIGIPVEEGLLISLMVAAMYFCYRICCRMKRRRSRPALLVSLLFLLVSVSTKAQNCTNFGIVTSPTPSECFASGTIAVTIAPEFQGLLLTNNAEYSLTSTTTGGYSRPFEHLSDGVIRNVPAGTYIVTMRAFCISSGIDVVSNSKPVAVGGSYVVPEAYANTGNIRKSLNCIPTGMVPIVVKGGKAPYTVTITGFPAGYTGQKVFNLSSAGTLNVDNLNPGNYTFIFADQCTYEIPINIAVDAVANDFPTNIYPYNSNLYPTEDGACSQVRAYGRNSISVNNAEYLDLNYYWNQNYSKYYEVSFSYEGTKISNWLEVKGGEHTTLTLPSGINYSEMFKTGKRTVVVHLRIKGSTCEYTSNNNPYLNSFSFSYGISHACSAYSGTFYAYSAGNNSSAACFPLEWKLKKGSCAAGTVIKEGTFATAPTSTQQFTVDNMEYNTYYYMCYKDANGVEWSGFYYQSKAQPWATYTNSYCRPDVGKSYIYLYNVMGAKKIEMTDAPAGAPTVPVVENYTSYNYFPFGTSLINLPFGTYKFAVTDSCGVVYNISTTNWIYNVKDFTYDAVSGCNGLKVYPKGSYEYANSTYAGNFRIQSGPSGVPIGNKVVQEGGYLELPENGRYVIQIQYGISPSGCAMDTVIIDYEKTSVSLDAAKTSAYVCEGDVVGYITLVAKGGSGNYLYELLNTSEPANNTGIFHFGTPGTTYTAKITDLECDYSFQQDVTMADLRTAKIVYSDKPDGQYCYGETIGLNCITLGQTTYNWTGPNGYTSNEQYPRIPDATASMSGVYTVSVKPEHCGSTLDQSLDINVTGFTGLTLGNDKVEVCETNPFTLKLSNDGGATSYKWYRSGTTLSNTANSYSVVSSVPSDSGLYKAIAINQYNCSDSAYTHVKVSPRFSTWTASGNNSDWQNTKNWDRGVPGFCTYVTIPGSKSYYPELQDKDAFGNAVVNACDTIEFLHGGEVSKTNYLQYNGAKVHLNLQSNRWYTLSAPLRDMYSGDYFHESSVKRQNPAIYMMQYQTTNPQTGKPASNGSWSNPFNTLNVPLQLGMGYSAWVDYGDLNNTTMFTLDFPKKSMVYDEYSWSGSVIGTYPIPQRTNANRFVYETGSPSQVPAGGIFTVPVISDAAGYTTSIVGNPYMSHLDFGAFYQTNQSKIQPSYQIWGGMTFEAVLNAQGITIATPVSDPARYIAPMQSFIVTKTNASSTLGTLSFAPGMSVTNPGVGLRATDGSPDVLHLEVLRDGVRHSGIALRIVPYASNSYDPSKDVLTYFNESDFVQEREDSPVVLYTMVGGMEASIRTIGDLSVPVELGLRTIGKGRMTLHLAQPESVGSGMKIFLEDRQMGHEQELGIMPSYTFDNTTGDITGRFYLKISSSATGIEDYPAYGIDIYGRDNRVCITSNLGDALHRVDIYDLSGRQLVSDVNIGVNNISYSLPAGPQTVIVKVSTQQATRTEKVILK